MPIDSRLRCAFALALTASLAAAQTPTVVTTPDGSRFWLMPSEGPPVVHWAIATPCGPMVDPPTTPGLALACVHASLRGTWRTGSLDEAREPAVLAALDQAESDLAIAPRIDGKPTQELIERAARLRDDATALSDLQAFRRVLLGAPATDIQVGAEGNVAIVSFSTTPAGVKGIAKLMLERREAQALRGLRELYEEMRSAAVAAWDQDPLAPLRAEALALAYPGSAMATLGDRPPSGGFSRNLALSVWGRTQHPAVTVHVLTGSFDVDVIRQALESTFTTTALPTPPAETETRPRTGPILRRALVPGALHPAAVIAWPLSGTESRDELACMAHWFADGAESWLGRELQRRGRSRVQLAVRVRWPGPPGIGLLVVEAMDPGNGKPDLADEILAACRKDVPKQPRPGELESAHAEILADWQRANAGGAGAARRLAADLRMAPATTTQFRPATELDYARIPVLLQQRVDGIPVVVEWRNP